MRIIPYFLFKTRDLSLKTCKSQFLARADIDGIKYPVDSYGGKSVKDRRVRCRAN